MAGTSSCGAWSLVAALLLGLAALSCGSAGVSASAGRALLTSGLVGYDFTVWQQYNASTTYNTFGTANTFGAGTAFDYAVYDSVDKANEIGRSHGYSIVETLDGSAVYHGATDTFTAGDYNGSSIVYGGHWDFSKNNFDLPILGGTGVFDYSFGKVSYSLVDYSGFYQVDIKLWTWSPTDSAV